MPLAFPSRDGGRQISYSTVLEQVVSFFETKIDKFLYLPKICSISILRPIIFTGACCICYQLLQYVTVPNKVIRVVHIFSPKWPEMIKSNLQPWFRLSIVVNHCSLFHTFNIGLILITQAKHVPGWIDWVNMTLECNQSRRKSSKLP